MENITVRKTDLLAKIRENRESHRTKFLSALEKYQERMVALLTERLEEIKRGKMVDHYIKLPVPEDHTPDYDRVIMMLEMDLNDEVDLGEDDFQQYVQDEWSWSRQFATTNMTYGVK